MIQSVIEEWRNLYEQHDAGHPFYRRDDRVFRADRRRCLFLREAPIGSFPDRQLENEHDNDLRHRRHRHDCAQHLPADRVAQAGAFLR